MIENIFKQNEKIHMPRLDKETKEQIRQLDYNILQEIVIKLASKDQSIYNYLLVNYLDKENGGKDLLEAAKADLDILLQKRYRGFSEQIQIANTLGACVKKIDDYTKTLKNTIFEADLLLYLLEVPFSLPENKFGTFFTQFDTIVAMIVKRLINVVKKKMHEDYRIEHKETINNYLQILHQRSDHIDTVYNMPKEI